MSDPNTGGVKAKRKNTKSDLGYRTSSSSFVVSFPKEPSNIGDDSTVAGGTVNDETSDTVRVKRKSHRYMQQNGRAISAIMLWVRNINKMRTIQMTKAFYLWKYYQPSQVVTQAAVVGDEPKAEERSNAYHEQKNSYLQLFAENERLREQVADIKRTSTNYERNLRVSAMQITLSTVLRKKLMMKQRYYFDLWMNNTRMDRLVLDTSQRAMELEVGLQQVESERDYVRKTQTENAKLRTMLATTIYFFKWKSRVASAVLNDERQKYERQRSYIFQELKRMRETVVTANQQERGLLHEAQLRGAETFDQLIGLREKLNHLLLTTPTTAATGGTSSRNRSRSPSGDRTDDSTNNNSGGGKKHGNSRRSLVRKHTASSLLSGGGNPESVDKPVT